MFAFVLWSPASGRQFRDLYRYTLWLEEAQLVQFSNSYTLAVRKYIPVVTDLSIKFVE